MKTVQLSAFSVLVAAALALASGCGGDAGSVTRTKEEALARIQQCLARREAGEEFETLAREYSDCPSSAKGGDLGEFPQGVMDPAFDDAAFRCEVGKLTGIVETPFGYHVIYRYE